MISLIAALASNGVIGRENKMPWHLPEDLKRFKALTTGHPIIMGRKTFESLGKPLPGRTNIVVSRASKGPGFVPSLEAAFEAALAAPGSDEIFVIGGAQIYEAALPRADRLYLTLLDDVVDGDAFFPSWDAREWNETTRERRTEPRGFSFLTLERHPKS
jgi:dihydrofolate reductase